MEEYFVDLVEEYCPKDGLPRSSKKLDCTVCEKRNKCLKNPEKRTCRRCSIGKLTEEEIALFEEDSGIKNEYGYILCKRTDIPLDTQKSRLQHEKLLDASTLECTVTMRNFQRTADLIRETRSQRIPQIPSPPPPRIISPPSTPPPPTPSPSTPPPSTPSPSAPLPSLQPTGKPKIDKYQKNRDNYKKLNAVEKKALIEEAVRYAIEHPDDDLKDIEGIRGLPEKTLSRPQRQKTIKRGRAITRQQQQIKIAKRTGKGGRDFAEVEGKDKGVTRRGWAPGVDKNKTGEGEDDD